ncbi:unnamed protein product, partial [Allacma fusca]
FSTLATASLSISESSQVVNSTVVAEALESDGSEKIVGNKFFIDTIDSGDIVSKPSEYTKHKAVLEILEFQNSVLTRLSQRLDDIEAMLKTEFKSLNDGLKMLGLESKKHFSELDKKLDSNPCVDLPSNILLSTQVPESTTLTPRTPEEYLTSLDLPTIGGSFNGKTIQEIAAEVPEDGALVVEIANYVNEDLTDYELHLPRGLEDKRAPKTISTRTKEVFTFKRAPGGYAPHGVLLKLRLPWHVSTFPGTRTSQES